MDQATPGPTTTAQPCQQCRTPFTARKAWQRFCSKACRRAYHKAGGESGLVQKVAQLEQRIVDLERMVWPLGK